MGHGLHHRFYFAFTCNNYDGNMGQGRMHFMQQGEPTLNTGMVQFQVEQKEVIKIFLQLLEHLAFVECAIEFIVAAQPDADIPMEFSFVIHHQNLVVFTGHIQI